jgi:hypothetical protein
MKYRCPEHIGENQFDDIVDALCARNPTLLREPLAGLAAYALGHTEPKLRRDQRAQYRNAFVLLVESLSQRIADNPAEQQEAGDDFAAASSLRAHFRPSSLATWKSSASSD